MAHATFVLRSEHAPAHAATAFNGAEGRGGVVRVARCRLPESAEVGVVIGRALQEFHEGSWVGPRSTAGNVAGDAGASARTASASYCAEWVDVWWCTTVTAEGSDYEYTRCEYEGRECARYVSVYDPPSGGGSPPGSGDDPDPCPSGPTDQLCVGGPGGGVVPTDPDPDPEPCDTGYAVIDAPGFQAGVEAAWNASNAQASDPYDRRERGGWIIRDPSSGAVSIVPIAGATYTPCGIDAPPGTVPPNGTIGLFHTHPYAVGDYADYEPCRRYNAVQRFPGLSRSHIDTLLDEIPQGTFPNTPYAGTPSDADVTTVRDIAAAYGVPDFLGIIADKDGFVVFDKNSTADQARGEHITITASGYDPTE